MTSEELEQIVSIAKRVAAGIPVRGSVTAVFVNLAKAVVYLAEEVERLRHGESPRN